MTSLHSCLHALVVCSLAWALLSAEALAQDGPAESPEYDALIDGAVAEFRGGHWAEARALFERAHSISPNARTLRGVGMVSFEMGDYVGAARALDAALAETRRPLTDEQRAQVTELLARARMFVGRFRIERAPSGSVVLVDEQHVTLEAPWPDGAGQLELGVGAHEVLVRAPDGRAARARVTVVGGESRALAFATSALWPDGASSPADGPSAEAVAARPIAPEGWLVLGGGVLAGGIGALLYGLGAGDVSRVEHAPDGTEWSQLSGAYDRGPALTAAGGVLFGVGSAAVVAGLVIAILDLASSPSAAEARAGRRSFAGRASLGAARLEVSF